MSDHDDNDSVLHSIVAEDEELSATQELNAGETEEPSMNFREQLAALQNRLLHLQNACTLQALDPDEDGEDYGPHIARLQEAIRSLRESQRLTQEDSHPPDEATSVASSTSDASVQATFQGTVPPPLPLRTRWQQQLAESTCSTPP